MSHFNEHTLEIAIMELFEQQGYSHVNGETIHKEQLPTHECCIIMLKNITKNCFSQFFAYLCDVINVLFHLVFLHRGNFKGQQIYYKENEFEESQE